jgi:hypothetical protein
MKLRTLIITAALLIPTALIAAPVEAANQYPCQKWHKALRRHELPVRYFAPIMYRESKCITRAVGWNYVKPYDHTACTDSGKFHARRRCRYVKSWDTGLLQINSGHRTLTKTICGRDVTTKVLTRPSCNLAVAKYLYDRYGLTPWAGNSN